MSNNCEICVDGKCPGIYTDSEDIARLMKDFPSCPYDGRTIDSCSYRRIAMLRGDGRFKESELVIA
jgi:hypothetical protein